MKKNISAALLSIVCFSAVSAAAFADGPVAGAINGIGRAGEDIVDGAGDAINGIVNGVAGAAGEVEDGLTPGGSDEPTDGDGDEDPTGGDEGDTPAGNEGDTPAGDENSAGINGNEAGDSESGDDSSDDSEGNGSMIGGNAANPGTGVTYGLSAAAAVLAAVGVVAASARKSK